MASHRGRRAMERIESFGGVDAYIRVYHHSFGVPPRLIRALRISEETFPLTRRQGEVITLVAEGMTNPEIAAALHLSTDTVKRHLKNASVRLGVRGRAALVREMMRRGLLH